MSCLVIQLPGVGILNVAPRQFAVFGRTRSDPHLSHHDKPLPHLGNFTARGNTNCAAAGAGSDSTEFGVPPSDSMASWGDALQRTSSGGAE
jgi:hypothetical protein